MVLFDCLRKDIEESSLRINISNQRKLLFRKTAKNSELHKH